MNTARTDAELLSAHVAGDPHAFGELIARHRDRLWSVALGTLRDPDEAADALQDACVSAFRAAPRFRGQAQVSSWLHRIVVNACVDRMRRRQAHPTVALSEQAGAEPAACRDHMADRETTLAVAEALAQLPEHHRYAVVLVDVQGYTVAEAAEELGLAEGTVKSRCARGRAKLAKLLGYLRNPDAFANVPAEKDTNGEANR